MGHYNYSLSLDATIVLSLREMRCARARAHVRALITRKSCAVGMRNESVLNSINKQSNAQILNQRLSLLFFIAVTLAQLSVKQTLNLCRPYLM